MPKKIVITGAESTGKSWLAKELSLNYDANYIPEFARDYMLKLNRNYTYHDVESIAQEQIEQDRLIEEGEGLYFLDTWLIITKVWFDKVFGRSPDWLLQQIENAKVDLFLLCDIDLPWINDEVRENGGQNRVKLQEIYKKEMEHYGFDYKIVSGKGLARKENAMHILSEQGII